MGVPDAAAQSVINRHRSRVGSIQGGDVPLGKYFFIHTEVLIPLHWFSSSILLPAGLGVLPSS